MAFNMIDPEKNHPCYGQANQDIPWYLLTEQELIDKLLSPRDTFKGQRVFILPKNRNNAKAGLGYIGKDETVKFILKHPGYAVTRCGNILTMKRKVFAIALAKHTCSITGQEFVDIYKARKGRVRIWVHRAVAKAYVYNPSPNKYTAVLHRDGDKTNNHADNLVWQRANALHSGMNHPEAVLTWEEVCAIRAEWKYHPARGVKARLARKYGISRTHVDRIISRKSRRKA